MRCDHRDPPTKAQLETVQQNLAAAWRWPPPPNFSRVLTCQNFISSRAATGSLPRRRPYRWRAPWQPPPCDRSSALILHRRWRIPSHRREHSVPGIASVSNGPGACDHDHAGSTAKSRFERDHHISKHFDSAGDEFWDAAANRSLISGRAAPARPTQTCLICDGVTLATAQAGGWRPPGPHMLALHLPAPDTSTCRARAQDRSLVANQAGSLAASAVNTEKDGHERSSIIRVSVHCGGAEGKNWLDELGTPEQIVRF